VVLASKNLEILESENSIPDNIISRFVPMMEEHIPLKDHSSWHQDDEITPLNPETNSQYPRPVTTKKTQLYAVIGIATGLFLFLIIYWFSAPTSILCDSEHCIKQAQNILRSLDQSIDPWYDL
jgi:hypothetical protein